MVTILALIPILSEFRLPLTFLPVAIISVFMSLNLKLSNSQNIKASYWQVCYTHIYYLYDSCEAELRKRNNIKLNNKNTS